MNDIRLIAFYLPQFHPIDENDAWWGKGFTEWTNVSSARPLFPGHYQPHVPADLGFYDLRMEEAREAQASLAREYGIHGFCYYYYYFNGKRLLNTPLDRVIETGRPDFPFCVCWANENWTRRWDGREDDILISQEHTPESDMAFIRELIPVLGDRRYIRIDGKLLLLVYRVELLPDPAGTAVRWREEVRKELGEELFLCTVNNFVKDLDPRTVGFDGAVQFPLSAGGDCFLDKRIFSMLHQVSYDEIKDNHFVNYPSAVKQYVNVPRPDYPYFRGVFAGWDNTPRRQNASSVFVNNTPEIYKLYLKTIIGLTLAEHSGDQRMIFVNAWNEWAEGAHLEPDRKFGHRFLQATKQALEEPVELEAQLTQIERHDEESRQVYRMARHLSDKTASAENKLVQATSQAESQRVQYEEKISGLNRKLNELEQKLLQLTRDTESRERLMAEKQALLNRKEAEIKEFSDRLETTRQLIAGHTATISQLESTLNRRDETITGLSASLAVKEEHLAAREELLKGREELIARKDQLIGVRDATIRSREETIAGKEALLAERDRIIASKEQVISGKEEIIARRDEVIAEKETLLAGRDRIIMEREQEITSLKRLIEEKEDRIREKEELLEKEKIRMASVDATLREKDSQIIGLGQQLSRLQNQVREKLGVIADREKQIQQRELIIKERERLLGERDRIIRDKDRMIRDKDRAIREKNERIVAIYSSLSWRLTAPVRWLHGFTYELFYLAFPYRSVRWQFMKNLLQPGWREKEEQADQPLPVKPAVIPARADIVITTADKETIRLIHESRLFDKNWYIRTYPDILKVDVDPIVHFVKFGAREGRHPNPLFATRWYMATYPDARAPGVNALVHYYTRGVKEGCDPNPLFSSSWYLQQYPDVARAGMNPLVHYLKHGVFEQKNLIATDPDVVLHAPSLQKVAVICHVYYPELWDQLSAGLFSIPVEFDLFISVPEKGSQAIRKRILSDFPKAIIKPFRNIGGDVNPFLFFLEEIHARNIPVFCKIHTKKGKTHYGDIWRAVMINGVLGSDSIVRRILNAFEENPGLAMAGPGLLYKSARSLEYRNRPKIQEMFSMLYPGKQLPEDWGFFAGTMFWGRTATFAPLAKLVRERFRFEKAELDVDGQLAHTVERILGAIIRHESLKIGLVTNELAIMHHRKFEIRDAEYTGTTENMGQTLMPLREMYFHAWKNAGGFGEKRTPGSGPGTGAEKIPLMTRLRFPFLYLRKGASVPQKDVIDGQRTPEPGKPNILLCGHNVSNHLAGGEVSFLDMVKGLAGSGFNLFILLPGNHQGYLNAVLPHAAKVFILPYKMWGCASENNFVVLQIKRIIAREKIDAVYVNTIMVREPLKAASLAGIPSVTHVRELLSGDETLTRIIGIPKEHIRDEVIRRTRFIIANSVAAAAFYQKENATYIVPNTIDTDEYDLENRIDPGGITVALISSNIPKKGIDEFVEVARICEKEIPGVAFLLIGPESEHYRRLRDQSSEPGFPKNLRFMGYCPRPVDAVRMANIVMNLSLFTESFGRTVLEAMAARRPVVAYDYGAISELIDEGYNGYLVPLKDVTRAAERIIELCRDPETLLRMGERGREIAVSRYGKESYARLLGQVMNDILARSRRSKGKPSDGTRTREAAATPVAQENKPSVSVIIPNYNYARYMPERIQSILDQTLKPSEILFLDDLSTDISVEVATGLLEKSGIPFKVIVNTTNQGTYKQWWRGFREVTGDYVWIAEADDSSDPRFLEKLTARLQTGKCVMGYCQSVRLDAEGNQTAPDNLQHTNDLSPERWKHDYTESGTREVVDYLLYRNTIPNVSACLFRREALMALDDSFTGFRYVGDWYLYSRLLQQGSIIYLAESLNKFRRHGESVTRVKGKTADYLKELVRIKEYILRSYPVHSSQINRMNWFLDKDFTITGVKKNSAHPVVASFLRKTDQEIKSRMRLVFITTNNGSFYGGSEQLWIETAVKMRKQMNDVWVVIKNWDPAPPFFVDFHSMGIRILFKEQLDFGEIVGFGPDLVVVSTGDQDEGTEYFDKCLEASIPYVIINQLTKEPKYWPVRKEKVEPVTRGYLGAKQVFFTCRNNHLVMEKRLGCNIPNSAIHFNPFHIDRDPQVPYPATGEGYRLAIPANLLRIHKGQHMALELMSRKKWRERPIFLNLYGKGADAEVLKTMARDLGLDEKVTFHERTPDLLTIWQANHAIFMPSFMEGLPIVLVGAMLCARVPVVTDIGGHREVIDDNINGFLAAEPDPEAIDEALERAWMRREEWEEMGRLAREKILSVLPEGDPVDDFISKIRTLKELKQGKR